MGLFKPAMYIDVIDCDRLNWDFLDTPRLKQQDPTRNHQAEMCRRVKSSITPLWFSIFGGLESELSHSTLHVPF
jgi:hypothetical protein